jgi:hypothetical protein
LASSMVNPVSSVVLLNECPSLLLLHQSFNHLKVCALNSLGVSQLDNPRTFSLSRFKGVSF